MDIPNSTPTQIPTQFPAKPILPVDTSGNLKKLFLGSERSIFMMFLQLKFVNEGTRQGFGGIAWDLGSQLEVKGVIALVAYCCQCA